jgi:hypothetical protein
MSTEEKKNAVNQGALSENDCHTDRKTTSTVSNKTGEIFLIDNVNFGIRYADSSKTLLPCNLPGTLQKAGKKVVFSGAIKETKPEELWAGEPFVLTMVKED